MNRQQLANKIWASANKMRSKIEANEYKDYILGFIFYKYLSDKEVRYLTTAPNCWTLADLPELQEEDTETRDMCRNNLGYFISYKHLFSTWLNAKGGDEAFSVASVRDAIEAFNRLIGEHHHSVFDKIFDTLGTGLAKLGDTTSAQTKAVSELLQLIKDIPTDGSQDYDVLGFIYEYLIGNFAANAGKKAGEFYTPHEVALLMAELVAHHLGNRPVINIYDPTSGSGSLLINIGRAVARYITDANSIKYYAQEIKENTYNLTRMNLVMRGILPDNIVVRCGDTLEDDWPYFDEADRERTYDPLYVDAVVSNPPYSQAWDPHGKDTDPRYAPYGLAPRGKADYAFLLHDLYHLRPDGIMTIVLPHGVLFRGGVEQEIRKQLVEGNHIDTIIGLPPNIFFGTGIPTIVMVLRQKRDRSDVMIVDASKGFVKEGKNNRLRACDIRRIVDAVTARATVERFSRCVDKDELRANDYNLNIPRYVDSAEVAEPCDLYASMFGGVPEAEIDTLGRYWQVLPSLRAELFAGQQGRPYAALKVPAEGVRATVQANADVKAFAAAFAAALATMPDGMDRLLVQGAMQVPTCTCEQTLCRDLFGRLEQVPLVDRYEAYQLLDDQWRVVEADLETLQTEGWGAARLVDPNMVVKSVNGKDTEVQDGWAGHLFPFELVQQALLKPQADALQHKLDEQQDIQEQLAELIDSLSDEEKDGPYLNDDNDAFVAKEVKKALDVLLADVHSPELDVLEPYLLLKRKADKLDYVAAHPEAGWSGMVPNADGTYSARVVRLRMDSLKRLAPFDADTLEAKLLRAADLLDREKVLKAELKADTEALVALTKTTIEALTDEQVRQLLHLKWIDPLMLRLNELPHTELETLVAGVKALAGKYAETYTSLEAQVNEAGQQLAALMDDLQGNDCDLQGLNELKSLLGGH